MRSSLALSSGRLRLGRGLLWAAGATGAILAGRLLAEAGQLGLRVQALVVVALIGIPVAGFLYLTKPHLVINAYVFLLPFLVSDPEATGVNAGEALSVAVVLGGIPLLVLRRSALRGPTRTMALGFTGLGILGAASVVVNSVVTLPNVANGVVKYFVFAAIAVLVYAFNDDDRKAESLVKVLVFSGIAVALFSIFEYLTGRSYSPEYGYNRASGTFEHWNQLGAYMALVSFPTLTYGLRARSMLVRTAYGLGWIAEIVALLLSLTLGAIVGVVVGAAVGAVMYFRRGILKTLFATMVGIVILALAWQVVPDVREKFETAGTRRDDRLDTYVTGFNAIQDHLWLGVGAEDELLDAVLASNRAGPTVSVVPHNAFLAIALEKGIVGAILLAIVVIAAFRAISLKRNWFAPSHRLLIYGIGMSSIAFLTQNMTNLFFQHMRLGVVWIAFHVAAARLAKPRSTVSTPSRERANRLSAPAPFAAPP